MIGGRRGDRPERHLLRGRHIKSCKKIMLCKKNKINSDLATIYFFLLYTDVRKCRAKSSAKMFWKCFSIIVRFYNDNN